MVGLLSKDNSCILDTVPYCKYKISKFSDTTMVACVIGVRYATTKAPAARTNFREYLSKPGYAEDATFSRQFEVRPTDADASKEPMTCVYVIVDRSDYDNPARLTIVADAYLADPAFDSSIAGINFAEKEYDFKGVVRILNLSLSGNIL